MMTNSLENNVNIASDSQCLKEKNSKDGERLHESMETETVREDKDDNSVDSVNESVTKRPRGRPCKRPAENGGIHEEKKEEFNKKSKIESSENVLALEKEETELSACRNQRSRSKSESRQCRSHPSKKTPSRCSSPVSEDESLAGKGIPGSQITLKRRGRPKKVISPDSDVEDTRRTRSNSVTVPRRRGRPSKRFSIEDIPVENKPVTVPRRRGRPSKSCPRDSSHEEEMKRERSRSRSASRPRPRGRPPKKTSRCSSSEEESRGSSKANVLQKGRGRPPKRCSSSESFSDAVDEETGKDLPEKDKVGIEHRSAPRLENRKPFKRFSSEESLISDGEREGSRSRRSRSKSVNSVRNKNNGELTPGSMTTCNDKSIEKVDFVNSRYDSVTRTRSISRFSRDESQQSEVERKSDDLAEPSNKKFKFTSHKPLPQITGNKDIFCWQCHRDGSTTLTCHICPRTYHKRCAKIDTEPETWVCIECNAGMKAASFQGRSEAMKSLSQEKFNQLLKFVMERVYSHEGADHFKYPVDLSQYEKYRDFIINPMDLSLMDKNINNSKYQSTESFLADLKWLLHNSYIFNSAYSELTTYARGIMKIAKQETEEIENCPNCYYHYHTMDDDVWFVEPCKKPHILVWAKLRGFPHWPAKVIRLVDDLVDVRFFGDHNRAWLPPEACYLFSKSPPFLTKTGKQYGYDECIKEIFIHIKKLKDKFGEFHFSSLRIKYSPSEHMKQLSDMLPALKPDYNKSMGLQTNPKPINVDNKKVESMDKDKVCALSPKSPYLYRKFVDGAPEKVNEKNRFVSKSTCEKNPFKIQLSSTQCTLKPDRVGVPTLQVIKSPIRLKSLEDKPISFTKITNSPNYVNGKIGNNSPARRTKVFLVKRVQDSNTSILEKNSSTQGILKIVKKTNGKITLHPANSPINIPTLPRNEEVNSTVKDQSKSIELSSDQNEDAVVFSNTSQSAAPNEKLNSTIQDQSADLSLSSKENNDAVSISPVTSNKKEIMSLVKEQRKSSPIPSEEKPLLLQSLNHDVIDPYDVDQSSVEIKEEYQDFTDVALSNTLSSNLKLKEPRVVLTKIIYKDDFIRDSSGSVEDENKRQEEEGVGQDEQITDSGIVCDNGEDKRNPDDQLDVLNKKKMIDVNAPPELPNDPGSSKEQDNSQNDLTDISEQMKETDEDIPASSSSCLIRVKPCIELLTSEALKRHNSQESPDDSHTNQNETSNMAQLSANKNCQKQVKTSLPPLPEMEIIKIHEEKDKKNPFLEHVNDTIEKVISGSTTVSEATLLSNRKLKKAAEKASNSAILVDSESSDEVDGSDREEEIDEEEDDDVDVNPDLDLEMSYQNIKDVSAWSCEPYVENDTVLSSMNDIFSSIEKAQNLEVCKNLMIKFKKLAFLQTSELKSFYLKTKNEATEICNMFKYEQERLISLKKELAKKIKKIKLTQWCSFCLKEANFYCCWGTSYCSKECQLNDWEKHYYEHFKQSENNQQDADHLRMTNTSKNTISLAPSITLSKLAENKQVTIKKAGGESVSLQLQPKSMNSNTVQPCLTRPIVQTVPFNSKSIIVGKSQINNVGSSIISKPLEIVTSPSSQVVSNPSIPLILQNNNKVIKICKNQNQNKVLVQNDQVKNMRDSVQANIYKVPLTTASSIVKKPTTGQFEKLYIVNKNSVPCLIRPVSSSTANSSVGKLFLKSSKIHIDSIAQAAGTRAS